MYSFVNNAETGKINLNYGNVYYIWSTLEKVIFSDKGVWDYKEVTEI